MKKKLFELFKYKKKLSKKYNQKLPLWDQVSKIICIGEKYYDVINGKVFNISKSRVSNKIINFRTNIIDYYYIDKKKLKKFTAWNEKIRDKYFLYRDTFEYAENNIYFDDGGVMYFVVKNEKIKAFLIRFRHNDEELYVHNYNCFEI